MLGLRKKIIKNIRKIKFDVILDFLILMGIRRKCEKNKTLTLNQLASLVNLTPKYLSALFHKETGQTLTVFIHKVLIEKAQNLLAHSDYSLGEISTYLNFSSQSYFISIFKRYTGITPGQYRKMHRQISW